MHKRSTLGLVIASAILATGCGGGGGGSSSSDGITETSEGVTVSGRAADGYLVQANVCADLNANGQCDAGEPTTTTGAGGKFSLDIPSDQLRTELVVEAIANLTVDEDNGQPVPAGFTLRSPILGTGEDQFVSPISTMVADEMKRTGATSAVEAKRKISQQLGTSFDLTTDYVAAAKDGSNPTLQRNAERLHRIAQVTARVMAEIESNITQSDLDEAGITKADFLALASRQIELLVSVIVEDIDATLDDPNFDPDAIVESPEYAVETPIDDGDGEPPTTGVDPVDPSDQLSDRISEAVQASPFFRNTPSGVEALIGSEATYFDFQESETLPDRYYYLGLKRMLQTGNGNTGTLIQSEAASKLVDGQIVPEDIPADTARVQVFMNGTQSFKRINEAFLAEIDVTGQNGTLSGEIFPGLSSPGLPITSSYAKIDLSALSTADTIASLYPSISAASFADISEASIFPDGSAAYALTETLEEPLFMTSWHGGGSICSVDAPLYEVQSCNVVYGAEKGSMGATPATTLDGLTYRDDLSVYTDGDYSGGVEAGIGFESGGQDYMMYLYGDMADGSGRIEVAYLQSDGRIGSAGGEGTWTLMEQPFRHIKLDLPDGIYFRAFLDDVGGEGYAFLHEHEGYVRAGRATPAGVELPVYFKRNPETLLLNETAADHVLQKLQDWNKLAENPGWTDSST